MKIVKNLVKMIATPLTLLDNKIVASMVKIFLILYAATIAPKLPNFMVRLLKNPLVKLLVLASIVYTGVKDPVIALLIAIGFTVSMMTLNKLEAANSLDDILRGAVDAPQSLLNDVVDGAQEIVGETSGLIGAPVSDIVSTGNKLVDVVQDGTNAIIDGAQDLVTSAVDGTENLVKATVDKAKKMINNKENFSMEDRTLDVEVPDMGTLDGLSGFDGEEIGAGIDFKEPEALKN